MTLLRQGSAGRALPASPAGEGGRLAVWTGWVLVGACALVGPLGWLLPRDFWIPVTLVGLLCLPAVRLRDADRPIAVLLFAGLIWAAVSSLWSPYHPQKPEQMTLLKMAFELPLYGGAVLAARRADPRLARRALQVLAFGCGGFGLILLAEGASQAAIYKTVRVFYAPMRADLAEARIGHATYVLGAIWPLAAVGAPRRWRPWLALSMFAGTALAALAFGDDAPVLALVIAPLAALVVWRWPSAGPRGLAALAVGLVLGMPAMVWAIRRFTDFAALQRAVPVTDAMRLGYWSHALDWIALRPLRGWGLDASRMFGPGIRLHPHNAPLQVWMELGAVGALLAAGVWGLALARLAGPKPSLPAAATAACAAVYLLFGVNFGVWQEWWLALAALIALMAAMNARAAEAEAGPEST